MNVDNLEAIFMYFKITLLEVQNLTEEMITTTVENDVAFGSNLNSQQKRTIVRKLMATMLITQGKSSSIRSECEPWLSSRKPNIDFYYWNRLREFMLAKNILPTKVIAELDSVTDKILDFSGNPADDKNWAQRGMVIGHVQSGKTTNYSALITKAVDSGYKVIIILAGLTKSLRAQTQERLDEYFIGKKSIEQSIIHEPMEILKFCEKNLHPNYGTSRDADFNKKNPFGVSLSSGIPTVFVIKKNKSILEYLNDWIKHQDYGEKIKAPLLLIDDEADNASVNTHKNPKETTTINRLIRELIDNFSRSTYVAYTATPFANIFIEPESKQEMEEEDLFPKNFIVALEAPKNYFGSERIFSNKGDLNKSTVRYVSDYVDILPLKHKINRSIEDLPPSLKTAVRVFLLAKALRYVRGQGEKHCSMMINVSRFNAIQSQVHEEVYKHLVELKTAIAANGKLGRQHWSNQIFLLEKDFLREFGEVGLSFIELLSVLHESSSTIEVLTVNMQSSKLEFEKHKKHGLHVIVIGGHALARGLTIEGLTISYILRNVGASDTLMQMARWFGYRTNYEDLCRIYIPKKTANHFKHISRAIEELRIEVERMGEVGGTPRDFGLKVRQSPTGIRITAANKMRAASEMKLAQDYSGRHTEAYTIFNDIKKNDQHRDFITQFFDDVGEKSEEASDKFKYPYWENISGYRVADLIKSFHFPATPLPFARISNKNSLLYDFISDRVSTEYKTWDVAIIGPRVRSTLTTDNALVPGLKLKSRHRKSGRVDNVVNNSILHITQNRRVADPTDHLIGLSSEQIERAEKMNEPGDTAYCKVRNRPLLLVHLFGMLDEEVVDSVLGEHCISLSVCLPSTNLPIEERTYMVNSVFQEAYDDPSNKQDDDDFLSEEYE